MQIRVLKMKKVIFICLLSLSMCLSDTNNQDVKLEKPVDPKTEPEKAIEQTPITQNTTVSPSITTPQVNTSSDNKTAPNPETNTNATKPNTTTPEKADNPTENKEKPTGIIVTPTENKDQKVELPKDNNTTKPNGNTEGKASAATNGTTADDKDKKKNDTTTEKTITTIKPTEPPRAVTEKPTVQARAFDGASFIGGIILTLGLLAIGFMGLKYYRNQTERNYHTL